MMPLIGTTVAIQATNVLPNTGKTITRMPITTCWANIHWNWPTRTWCGGLHRIYDRLRLSKYITSFYTLDANGMWEYDVDQLSSMKDGLTQYIDLQNSFYSTRKNWAHNAFVNLQYSILENNNEKLWLYVRFPMRMLPRSWITNGNGRTPCYGGI